jgi:hypothetical protein
MLARFADRAGRPWSDDDDRTASSLSREGVRRRALSASEEGYREHVEREIRRADKLVALAAGIPLDDRTGLHATLVRELAEAVDGWAMRARACGRLDEPTEQLREVVRALDSGADPWGHWPYGVRRERAAGLVDDSGRLRDVEVAHVLLLLGWWPQWSGALTLGKIASRSVKLDVRPARAARR